MQCNKQKYMSVAISRKPKKSCYVNLDLKDIVDIKKILGNVKPLFPKTKSTHYINLGENSKIINNEKEIEGFSIIFCEYNT